MGVEVIAAEFPDPQLARMKYWLPHIKKLGADENTILVGHSSGAVAAMRYAEENKILGSVLVGVAYTDLGEKSERLSGYFDKPWQWDKIRNNQRWVLEFSSTDDPYIPIEEARFVHDKLQTEYYEFTDKGHFMISDAPEIFKVIKKKIEKA